MTYGSGQMSTDKTPRIEGPWLEDGTFLSERLPFKVGSLFAGIGGFDLGLERAGMETAFFVEREPYCQRVLAKHWPDVPIFDDVCDVGVDTLPAVDVLCGGFPCQDISVAGKGAGIDGARSGLWSEYIRLIRELRPRYVIVENVPALRSRGLWRVLGELAESGYDAEWDGIPASAVGAHHQRDRIWIVAYPQRDELREQSRRRRGQDGTDPTLAPIDGEARTLAHANRDDGGARWTGRPDPAGEGQSQSERPFRDTHSSGRTEQRWPESTQAELEAAECSGGWSAEPDVGRVAHGVPARVDRLRALGNALVPQIAEWIGRRILEYEDA